MRPRLFLLRRDLVRSSQSLRAFAQSTTRRTSLRTRPQLLFLSVPSTPQRVRFLTTERKARLKDEIKLGIKITAYIWIAAGCVAIAAVAVCQDLLEKDYPTPPEWSWRTRLHFCASFCERDQTDPSRLSNPIMVINWIKSCVERLEDPNIDGKDVRDAPADRPPGSKDITAKSENWRRGYFEAMMMYAKSAEHVDGWMRDTTRNLVFPGEMVIGPSNPKPRPLAPGYTGASKEENCVRAWTPADDIYLRLIGTEGLTTRQRIDATLAFASWLEFKGVVGPAGILYEDALDQAITERPSLPADPVDRKTLTLNDAAGQPSANLLTSLTALATFKARHGEPTTAFPALVSILRARRNLPPSDSIVASAPDPSRDPTGGSIAHINKKLWAQLKGLIGTPPYPPPPDDGRSPPPRDAKEMCEEAALSLHIGEVLYASKPAAREEGLGWTRDAVDIAEEQLHRLRPTVEHRPARTACRECLSTGLGNWAAMVRRLAQEEAEREKAAAEQPKKKASWLGLWGGGAAEEEHRNRWAAEEKVIEERQRRAQDLLEELEPTANGLAALFTA
ncbi:hypothetical protein QBC39DRAFT_422373 [Podospora conica]|nr:hypothetical protein QBC39DRAFT_422373 [Schizothecium conicum]